jgi:hypothetical protein
MGYTKCAYRIFQKLPRTSKYIDVQLGWNFCKIRCGGSMVRPQMASRVCIRPLLRPGIILNVPP